MSEQFPDRDKGQDHWRRRIPRPHEPIGQCPKCGLKLYRVMGYFCLQEGCPCGLGSNTTMTGGGDR